MFVNGKQNRISKDKTFISNALTRFILRIKYCLKMISHSNKQKLNPYFSY